MQQPHPHIPVMATMTFAPNRPVRRAQNGGLWIGLAVTALAFVLLAGMGIFLWVVRNPELGSRLTGRPAGSAITQPMASASAGLTPRTFDRNPFEDSPP